MPNKITYTITTSDGKSHQVDEQNINKYGMQSYADAYKGATIRMRDKDGADYDIPLNRFTQARGQGLRPFRFEHRGTSANTQAGSHAQQVADEYDESVRRTQPRMTAAQKAKMSNWASSFGQNVGQATRQATQALKRQNDARKDNALRVRRENVGVDAAPYKLGENPNVVETGSTYNPQSGKVEKTYLTDAGNEYVGRDVADLEQNIIDDQKAREMDPVNTTLRDAYAERDRLEEAMRQRMKEIGEERNSVNPVVRAFADLTESTQGGQAYNPFERYQRDEQYRQLEAAARKNRATIQTLEDKRDNKMNDFFHSIATTAANGYTFNDGLSEINDAIALLTARKHINSINRKQATGEPLTEEEQAAASVLAADALNAEVQGQYAGDYGEWARAGQMVPTSIDLMKDIMLTPGAGGIAKGIAGRVGRIGTRFLAKQAGETAAKSAAKAIGRSVLKGTGILLGAHTAGAVVSNTAGIGRTIGAMGTNLAGQTVKDAQGNYKVQDSMDVLDAFVDAERNQIRETGSEMFGEFLPGAGGLIKKGLEKIGLSKISNALTNIGNKQWYQQYNRLLTAGGYNGIPGEALEEYEGMAFDALTGNAGETWQQLKDPRTHVDIWLGTAAMSALLGAAPVTIQGAHTAMYYRYKHATDKADRTAAYRFGDNEKWNGLKDVIDNTPNEDMANAVMDIMNDSSLYPEQKTAALNYVRNLTKMRGYNIGQMSNANEESEESKAANESYANGYNTENPEELNQIKNRYEVAREKALQAFPQETLDEIENDNSLLVQYVEAPTLRKIVVDYLNTKQAYDGMIQRVRDDIDTQVQQSNDMIESRINKTTGMIQPAMMKAPDENGNERRAYVISGNIEMLADMSGVDREKSDGSILVRYADTGEMEMVSPSAIMRVDDAISPEQEQQEAETNITQTYAQQKANEIDGRVAFAQGDVYTLTDEAGKVAQVTVVPNKDGIVDNGDGTVNVDAGTGEVVAMPKDAIQIMIDRTNKNKVVPQEEPAAAVTYNLNDDVYVQDENGNIVHGVITGDVNEDGQYEVQTDTPVKNVLVNLYTPDQFVQQPQATTTEQPAAEQAPAEQATEQPSAEQQPTNEQQVEQTQAATAQEEQKSAIPTDEKGNMLYHQVPVETTINDLYDGRLDDNEIRDFVDANISEADKNLEKVNKKAPKIGTNKAEYLKKKQEWQKQVEDATRIRDYWNSVKDYIAQQTHTTPEEIKAAQDELSGEAARREYQDMGGSVQQDAVSVASDFIRGAKITPESFKAETGYGTDEQRKFVGMIAKAEKGGKTIDRLAEELVSYDNAEMNGVLFGGDTSSAKDAILSALQGAGTRGELKQTNEAEEQAYVDTRNAARDAQYMEQYGMTYEEYLAYEEQIMPTIWREYNNYDETAFNNMYAEEIEQLLKSRENDTTGEKPTDDRGNQVLPEQQVTEQRGSADGTEPGTEVQAGVQGTDENAVAPEETQERIIQPVGINRFGNIYNWAKGQFQSAALFLNNLKSGYLRSVFYRDGIGDIDMVWGNDKAGLQHIIKKHIEEADDFSSVEEAMQIINDTISNGDITRQGSNISLDNNGYRVSIAQSEEGNWVLTAFDKTRSRAEKKRNKGNATIGDQSVSDMENGTLASPQLVSSESKDSEKSTITSSLDEKIAEEGNKVDTNPTDGQKEAGNYKKGHVRIDGYDITIEQPKGSVRRGTDADGKQWEQTMNNTYGYIRGTEGVDGDHIDIFLSDNPTEGNVYVVDQVNPDGSFDEHKVMYGFQSAEDARAAYLSNYEEGWQGLGTITEVSKEEFKKWVNSSRRKTKPFAEYKSVNAIGAQNEGKTTDKVKSEKPAMQKVNVEGIFNELNKKGETKLSDNAVSVEEDKTQDNSSIQGLQGYSRDKIKNIVKDYVEQKLSDADADAKIKGVEIHGSRNRGDAREDSDLDVVIEYEGDIREDDMFNLLNDDEDALSIENIRVDINPIREQETGTLDKYMERSRKYDEEKKVKEVSPEILSFRQKKIDELNAVKDEDVKKGPSAWYFDMPLLVSAKTKKSAISKMHQRREDDIQSINNGNIDWMYYNAIKEKGIAGYEEASSVEEKPAEEKRTEYGANNKVVSKERYEELKKRMIKKLGQLNFGMDPELIEIGVEMTAYHLEAGARKFADYAKAMINDVGDVIRPYLKSLYNAARDYPDVVEAGLNVGMSTGDEVSKFDVTNFDKKTIDALATADNVVKEQNIKKETEKIIKENEKKSEQTAKKSVSSQKIADLFGDINESTKSDAQRRFSDTVKSDMLSALDRGEKPYRSIVDLRKRASEVGMDVDNEGRSDILLQELVEDGLVGAAREVINKYGSDSKDSYDLICKLYDMQPTIAARSSNRIKMQQYSTPLPMAWNAAHFAMSGKQGGKVLEPTAGNGMLVFAVPANQVHANELDETRLNNLREQGFAEVTQQDATEPFEGGKQYDAIIANPPFGSRKAVDYDGKMIPGLDPQITLNALSSMKDDGKAAIIIGGNMEYAKNGSIKSMKPFFTYLYDHYNVKGVVDMDGKLYAKQGTTFPTRMILIDGRRSEEERAQTTVYPPVESNAVAKANSFEELYNTVNDIINSKEKTNGTEILHSRERELLSVNNRPSGDAEGNRRPEQPRKNDTTGRGNKPEGSKEQSERVLPGERGKNTGDGETRNEVAGSEQRGSRGNNEPAIQRVGGERVLTERVGLKEEPKKRSLTEEKLPYRPHNTAFSLNSVAPSAMVEAMDKILTQIEKENGSIDEFVRKELGYDTIEEAHQALAAEQMDSVAMAIYQMKKGQALIIGDQTGVGKGRQMAALIRWAVKRGEKPIFITQKADLFSDIYRDLVDVGSGDLVPFIFNSDGAMVDSNGNVVHKPLSASAMSKVFASGELPDSYDFAVLTYSQVNTGDAISQKEAEEAAKKSGTRAKKSKASKEGKPTPKATFLRAIAKDNYLFLDESHTAAGSSNTGAYLQSILKSAKAATFASATFAKRPDTMPLYAIRTAMSQAKIEPEKLISIIEKGGVTLQEIMSRELTNAGQMVRRERDMSDVKTDWKTIDDPSTVKRARENYDKTIQAFNAIIKFQNDFVKPKIDDLDQSLAIVAQSAGVKKGTDKMGVENVPFASKTYNYTKQLMLALKVDAIADEVEKEIKAGRHPVIALESTMESTIKDYSAGEVIKEPTFSASLLKGLDSVMQYTIKDEDGKETHARYAPSDLGKAGEEAYYNLQKLIRESTSDIFISPLDAIIERLHEKGYKVGELTGRNLYVERNENGEVVVKRRTDKDKKKMQRDFNSGNLDVLILNKSASTGISLHASEKFKDQRQRTMIIAQPLSDINDYMQMIGRIDRTGQVHRGYYINLGLPVPAENRFLMMLSTKLKSLNANTTTSQDSKSNEVEAPDLLNKYGSQVVVEYLRDNPEVYEKMGAPLKKGGLGSGKVQASELDEYKPQDDDARKITGYVALLSTKEQEDFYNDVVKRYNDLIQYLNDTGSNDLKINVMPLRAKTLEKRVSSEGIDPNGTNPFAKNAYVEKVEMDVLRKPMKAEEVRKTIDKLNKTSVDVTTDVIRKESDAKISSENARYENAREKALDDIQKQKEKIEKSKKLSDEEKVAAINSYITDTNNTIEERHDKNLKKITDNRDQLIRRLRMFDAGKSYLVPDNLESMAFDFASPAIFCGYKAKENKITASTTLAVFATLDSRRRIEIKLSDINALQSIDKMTMDNIDAARAITLDNWDSQIPTETRKEGYILTGNILQAIADSQDEYGGYTGHLVSYTDIDGNIHDGILMPDKWNTSLLKSSGAPLSARMEQIKRYESIVSSDGKVTLNGSQWAEMYYLTVPKTKKDGAMYYENKVLLDSSKGVFYPYRGKLRADIPAKNIEGVVKELTKLGVKVRQSNDVVSEGSNTNEKTNDLYRFIGETGARNLDAAEEATTRLDNLSTARQMEQAYNDKKARIDKLRDSKPVEITGEEYKGKYDLNRDSAQDFILKNLRGEYTIADTGEKVTISKVGAKKVTSHSMGNNAHLKSIVAIPQLLENAIFIEETPNEKSNGKYDSYRYYVVGLKIGNEDYTARITIGVKNGEYYYDHYLTEIEKGNLIEIANGFIPTGDAPVPSYTKSKDTRLISLLQTNDQENARKIKLATGWERGADGKWKYETPDFEYHPKGDARRNDKYKESEWYKELHVLEEKLFNGETLTDGETKRFDELSARVNAIRDNDRNTERIYLGDYVEDNELFKAYPELKQTKIDFVDLPNEEYSAKYNEKENRITVNQAKSIDDKSAIAHEIQHAIQHIEGFAQGSNVDNYNSVPTSENVINDIIDATDGHILDGGGFDNTPEGIFNALNRKTTYGTILRDYSSELDDIANKYGYETIFDLVNDIDKFKSRVEMYLSEAGEVEARNVEARINMTPEQRRQSLASETEDVAREDQLFIYDNLGVSARQGTGALTDSELSNANDPAGKMLGKPSRTPAQQRAFAARERQRMADRAREVADILHLDNVEIVTDASTLQGRRAKAKGFYSRDNGKIVIVVPNHVDMADIEQTVLHEAVAHYGLRKLFGSNFDTFINNVYNNADENVRREIVQLAAKHNWDFATATEEYLASLAENTNFEDMNASWWNKIKDLFLSMVRSIGLKGFSGKTLSDNELRYILWRSYENLKNPGRYRNVFSEAEDIAKQNELKVGNYAVRETRESVADNDLYREVELEERRRVYVADIYDARIKNGMYQMREAVQDSMLSLREAMTEILKAEGNKNVKIEDISGFENAYLGENRLSSVNKAEADAFANLLFKPLLEEAANLSGSEKGGRDELVNYMMAKHGLERNKVMAERDAKNEYDNYVKEHPKGEKTLDDFIDKYRKRDYAGLTALTGKEKVAEAEAEAQQMVDDYDAEHDTEELWNKTRAVSNAILDKEYDTGLMSKETMEKLKSMFDFYIPLRGFDEKTSEDEYAYLENKNSAFFAPIKAAKGRKSKADDPFAYLQGMAENAIMQGNRNKLVKQKFLNFVLNHQSDLASVSDLWLKYNEVNDEWGPVFPDNIKDTDSAKEVERKMQEFEERMKQLAEENPELYKHGRQTVEVPYRVVESRDLKQHQILVRRNGRNYVITINGNPRAAQAVNGLTNPDNDMSGAIGAILKAGQNINRQLSALYTTKNPDFVVSNFIRDALYANSMAWVKERPNYALRFHKNYVLANPIKMKKLFARYRKNKLKANSKTDMMFKQFMLNGGETGYASVRDIEKRKNEISKEIKKYQGKLPIKKAWGYLAERFDEFNRAVENSARFAAFVTSREMGRSIERSIYDAKEISVNFNKKGSGSKFMGATGQTKLGNAGAFISGLGRSGFVFWNAAIQGSTNFGRQVKRNPAKALTAMATMFMLGAVVASLGYGDDDDDDKNSYWNLPDYVRRSNIMFRAGDQWVSIPLPVEYRSLYGLGELMISTMSDKEHLSGEEIANQIAGQISQVMPIDFLEGEGGAKAFIPSFIKPFAEAYGYNRSWTGLPIYKDTPYNKDMPEWTKAYKSANKYLVDLSETLNEATGGDKYTKGEIDINPAKIEHVLTGYFGGIANTIDRLTKMGETAIGQREYDPNSFLIMNRIIKNGDERTEYKAINNEYFRIKEEHDKLKKRLNNYERDTDNGVFDYAEKIDFLYNSPEYRRLEIYEEYQPDIEDLILMMKETNDADEQKDIEAQINELKKMMISDINKYARK